MKILATIAIMLVVATSIYAADVDGKWAGTIEGPAGEMPVNFTFKADGEKLTGSTMGPDGMEVQIKDGKVEGNNISFTISFDFGGMPLTLSYKGVVSTDSIKMTAEVFGMPFEFALKKAK